MKNPRAKPLLSVFVLAAIFAALCGPAGARSAAGILAGVVLDSHGNPVAGATVTLQTSDGQHPHATRTDASGHFAFVRFTRGQYDLRAASGGAYSDWLQRIMVHAGRTTQVTLRLTR